MEFFCACSILWLGRTDTIQFMISSSCFIILWWSTHEHWIAGQKLVLKRRAVGICLKILSVGTMNSLDCWEVCLSENSACDLPNLRLLHCIGNILLKENPVTWRNLLIQTALGSNATTGRWKEIPVCPTSFGMPAAWKRKNYCASAKYPIQANFPTASCFLFTLKNASSQ